MNVYDFSQTPRPRRECSLHPVPQDYFASGPLTLMNIKIPHHVVLFFT